MDDLLRRRTVVVVYYTMNQIPDASSTKPRASSDVMLDWRVLLCGVLMVVMLFIQQRIPAWVAERRERAIERQQQQKKRQ